ncbi:MAG: putative Pescadillo [Streblomastix strix]|uniref:Pescadillo homolog n=1 Tax=Streblomastix strix TaxID=222440 RepID=A0A5J4WGQ3_9EUKA|nr:MAG: putative Pescadillo [Streblomastix strix]
MVKKHGKKKAKKTKRGPARYYLPRTRVLKHLQVSLKQFRRLAIMNGIFPRIPVKSVKDQSRIYYHIKDVKFLQNCPMMEVLRQRNAMRKKFHRALIKQDKLHIRSIKRLMPQIPIAQIVKDRYPSFEDALKDLSDALNTIYLFSEMTPKASFKGVDIILARRLRREWNSYVATTHTLRRAFISIKGTYFQAEVYGTTIIWMEPHHLQIQDDPRADLFVMHSFFELHSGVLKFVLFKLYQLLGLKYPPPDYLFKPSKANININTSSSSSSFTENENDIDAIGASTTVILPVEKEGIMKKDVIKEEEESIEKDKEKENNEQIKESSDTQEQKSIVAPPSKLPLNELFKGCVFYMSREIPIHTMSFVVLACGGRAIWEGKELNSSSSQSSSNSSPLEQMPYITHQVTDRPVASGAQRVVGRKYIQPQYIVDCLNSTVLLPVGKYVPGAKLPPHVSPFVDINRAAYVPEMAKWLRDQQRIAKGEIVDEEIKKIDDNEEEQEEQEQEQEQGGEDQNEDDEDDDEDDEESISELSDDNNEGSDIIDDDEDIDELEDGKMNKDKQKQESEEEEEEEEEDGDDDGVSKARYNLNKEQEQRWQQKLLVKGKQKFFFNKAMKKQKKELKETENLRQKAEALKGDGKKNVVGFQKNHQKKQNPQKKKPKQKQMNKD